MAIIKNTRFPHRCTIYSISGVTPFSDGVKTVLWEGRCRKEDKTFGTRENVPKTNYRVQLGAMIGGELSGDATAAYKDQRGREVGAKVEGIKAGMLIDVQDLQGEFKGFTVTDAICGQLGTTVYFGDAKT